MKKEYESYVCEKECANYLVQCYLYNKSIHITIRDLVKIDRNLIKKEANEVFEAVTSLPQYRLQHLTGQIKINFELELFGFMHQEEEIMDLNIEVLQISSKALRILKDMGVKTVQDLVMIMKRENTKKYLSFHVDEIQNKINKLHI